MQYSLAVHGHFIFTRSRAHRNSSVFVLRRFTFLVSGLASTAENVVVNCILPPTTVGFSHLDSDVKQLRPSSSEVKAIVELNQAFEKRMKQLETNDGSPTWPYCERDLVRI